MVTRCGMYFRRQLHATGGLSHDGNRSVFCGLTGPPVADIMCQDQSNDINYAAKHADRYSHQLVWSYTVWVVQLP